jgi:hypothetical protein
MTMILRYVLRCWGTAITSPGASTLVRLRRLCHPVDLASRSAE